MRILPLLLAACTPDRPDASAVVDPDLDTGRPPDSAETVGAAEVIGALDVTDDVVVSDPSRPLPDPEFEPGGDRVVWQDGAGRGLWLARLDLATGALIPANGRGTRLDRDVGPIDWSRNGPEWVSTASGSRVVYVDRTAATPASSVLAQAWQDAAGWHTAAIPGTTGFLQPFGTQVPGDADPLVRFRSADVPPRTGELHLLDPTRRFTLPLEVVAARFGLGLRALTGMVGPQVVRVDEDGARMRLTSDPTTKAWPFLVPAPERGGELLLVAARARSAGSELAVWRQVGGSWTIVRRVPAPAAFPWIDSPEPFVWNGRSYVVYAAMQGTTPEARTPSEVWVASLDPASPSLALRICGPETLERRDPEFKGGARPWAWYTEATGDRRVLHRCEVPLP